MTSLSRLASIVATPLLFGWIAYHPPYVGGFYPSRIVPGLLFGVMVLGVGLLVEGGDAS